MGREVCVSVYGKKAREVCWFCLFEGNFLFCFVRWFSFFCI